MANAFVEKLKGYAPLSNEEVKLLEEVSRHGRRYASGQDMIREGDKPGVVFVVLEGWACRYKILPGGSRQIISFLMPGDFCDMHVAVLDEMDHSIATLTEATIVTIPRATIEHLTSVSPTLVKAFWWTQLVDEGVLRATIVSMGRRTSLERVAHLLCELSFRMRNIGIANEEHIEMPFSQIVLADAVGLTPVHVNRVVGKLRRAGALTVTPATLIVANLSRLAEIAGFDDNYLHRRISYAAGTASLKSIAERLTN
ncbi:Crp/Fnr family transcriptional regulator [Sphingomonas abietis]|uniref:Crp/Fnr family transcriptional regulator n=1 Tax=Sphingomonas abietis TaxID=3012344 RepID=A0ABY7NS92_9SPHN|nr:Crp/Fnr family transcriptional regulator [Sphingomonas abietis]WBO24431.1 Crp/Fnr family transcriptional regulator [Sphingomonas abietis]